MWWCYDVEGGGHGLFQLLVLHYLNCCHFTYDNNDMWSLMFLGECGASSGEKKINYLYFFLKRQREGLHYELNMPVVGWLAGRSVGQQVRQSVSHIVSGKEPLRKYFDKLHQKDICVNDLLYMWVK
jgi:hypothetical protein